MKIFHIGKSQISTTCQSLQLNNILHIPQAARKLLSVHQFTADNNVFLEFYPNRFCVKDQSTKKVLQGRCEDGLYPIKPQHTAINKKAFVNSKPTPVLLHYRLGHPSKSIVQEVFHSHKLPCLALNKEPVYGPCQLAKSRQLPYVSSHNISSSSLELIFSDV